MQLDVSSRPLPRGHLVNKEGGVSRLSSNGHYYCVRTLKVKSVQQPLLLPHYLQVYTYCSSKGPGSFKLQQCAACKALEGPRYASVHSENAIEGTDFAKGIDTDTDSALETAQP